MALSAYDAFISNPKCDNKKNGDESINDTMSDAEKYYVYVVWRLQ